MKEKAISIDDLLSKVSTYIKDDKEIDLIKKAYEFANDKYFNEMRLDGNSLINHHLNVAMILTELHSDYETIIASLLHEILNYDTTIGKLNRF